MYKRITSFLLILCMAAVFLPFNAKAAEGEWVNLAPMTTARYNAAVGYWNGKIYVVGGFTSNINTNGSVEIYDIATNTWSAGTKMSYGLYQFSGTAVGSKIYCFGGTSATVSTANYVTIYDMETDTWIRGQSMPTARQNPAVVAVGNEIYVMGSERQAPSASTKTMEVYNTEDNTWRSLSPIPEEASISSGPILYDGKIYFFSTILTIYDIANDQWTIGETLPVNRSGTACVEHNGLFYTVGKNANTGLYIYDPATNEWTAGPDMNTARINVVAILVDDTIYAFGGNKINTVTSSIYKYVEAYQIPYTEPAPGPSPDNKELAVVLYEGETTKMAVSKNANINMTYTWTSTDESVAMVNGTGVVSALQEGLTYIYAENDDAGFRESIPVQVLAGDDNQDDDARLHMELSPGDTLRLALTNSQGETVTWTSFDTDIATVDQTGLVTVTGTGLVIIQAECDGNTYHIYIRA